MTDRIKLAEAMGWELINYPNDGPMWRHSSKRWVRYNHPPDPFTDANDCEALIQFLDKEKQLLLTMNLWQGRWEIKALVAPELSQDEFEWKGEDWKQGVCELALKVLK